MNYNYIIVEDNLGNLKNLQTALKPHVNFKEIGVAHSVSKGISLALTTKPHIIFLDVELGDENGFDLIKEIRQFTTEMPFIIMTTGVDKYAKKAVNTDVLYFLEKPIDPDELTIALELFEKKFLSIRKHITLKDSKGHYLTNFDDVTHIKADSSYVYIFFKDDTKLHVNKTLKEMESILPLQFLKVHRSYIVNRSFIKMINTSKKIIKLSCNNSQKENTIVIDISDTYIESIKQTLLV